MAQTYEPEKPDSTSDIQTEFIMGNSTTGPVGFEPTVSELSRFSFGG